MLFRRWKRTVPQTAEFRNPCVICVTSVMRLGNSMLTDAESCEMRQRPMTQMNDATVQDDAITSYSGVSEALLRFIELIDSRVPIHSADRIY